MVDSESVGIGGEVAPWLADLPVVPEARGEGEQADPDARAESGQRAGPVTFEAELALAGPEHRLDPLADPAEGPDARLLVAAVGPQEGGAPIGHPRFELPAREPLVGDDRVAIEGDALEHPARDLALGRVRRRELEGDRGAVGRAEQVEPKSPEESGMRAAVPVGGDAGE